MSRFVVGAVIAAALAAIVAVLMQPKPTTADRRARLVERLRTALPQAQFAASGDLTVHVGRQGHAWSVDLKPMQEACAIESATQCEAMTEALVGLVRKEVESPEPLRVVDLRPTLSGFPADAAFARDVLEVNWVGDLRVRFAFFRGVIARYVTAPLAKELQLEPAQMMARALAAMESSNDAPVLRPIIGMRGVSYLDGEADPSAAVLSRARMFRFSERTGLARVLVAFPERNKVILANADTKTGPPDIRGAVTNMTGRAGAHVVSKQVFLWEKGELREYRDP
jgi:hypothetical protein